MCVKDDRDGVYVCMCSGSMICFRLRIRKEGSPSCHPLFSPFLMKNSDPSPLFPSDSIPFPVHDGEKESSAEDVKKERAAILSFYNRQVREFFFASRVITFSLHH